MNDRLLARKAAEKRGRSGELLAALLLVLKGYRILGRRVKTRAGEIDLIAKSPRGVVCFVEVKARPDEGLATEAIGLRQRARIVRAAGLYLAGRPAPARFDVVTVVPGRWPRHLKDAWRPDDLA
ncbi:MAG TPA: YraN family protein [Rhizomicrobium sp.]|nr:YraN family protein [Rhizomicrobium sp.]